MYDTVVNNISIYYDVWLDFIDVDFMLSTKFCPWFMLLTLFTQLTYVNRLHWIVGIYYYGFLVNEGMGVIIVILTFPPSSFSVLYK